jgi:hypothetical protein
MRLALTTMTAARTARAERNMAFLLLIEDVMPLSPKAVDEC